MDAVQLIGKYLATTEKIQEIEARHDEVEAQMFSALDRKVCQMIDNLPVDKVDDGRAMRLSLHAVHARFRCRRAAVVADSAEDLASAITVAQMEIDTAQS